MRFWVGGYAAGMGGSATGIGGLVAGEPDSPLTGGELAFTGTSAPSADSPSWLTPHPSHDIVYAALEGAGAVQAYRRTGELSLRPLGAPVPVGDSVCHIAVAPDASALIASCWGDGRVVLVNLNAGGRPGAATIAPAAVDPYAPIDPEAPADPGAPTVPGVPGAAEGAVLFSSPDVDLALAAQALRAAAGSEFAHLVPDYALPPDPASDGPNDADDPVAPGRVSHAHQAVFLPGGLLATTDMGFDLVRFWRRAPAGLRPVGAVPLPRGSGPRHMVRHPSGHLYVVTELSCEVFALAPDRTGAWRIVGGTTLAAEVRPGADLAAELAPSADGEFLYAGVRGSDTLAAVRVRGGGETLVPVALAETGVVWPRHHLIVRDTVLVAGERSDQVSALTLDLRTGVPSRTRRRVEVPTPTCLLPVR